MIEIKIIGCCFNCENSRFRRKVNLVCRLTGKYVNVDWLCDDYNHGFNTDKEFEDARRKQ